MLFVGRDEGHSEAAAACDGAGSGGARDAARERGGGGRGGRGGRLPNDPVRPAQVAHGVAPRSPKPSRHLGPRGAGRGPLAGGRHLARPPSQHHFPQRYVAGNLNP